MKKHLFLFLLGGIVLALSSNVLSAQTTVGGSTHTNNVVSLKHTAKPVATKLNASDKTKKTMVKRQQTKAIVTNSKSLAPNQSLPHFSIKSKN